MEKTPEYSQPTDDKELLADTKKLVAEANATLPEALIRDEKEIYADSYAAHAPEVVHLEDTGMELDNRPEPRGPEAVATDSPLYHVHGGTMAARGQDGRRKSTSAPELDNQQERRSRRICGLTKWPFIFVLVACVLAVAVALGAGLATTLSKKSKSPGPPAASSSIPPLTTTPTPSATTSTPAATPSLRDFRDPIKYNLTVWEGKNFTGAWQFIDSAGYYKLGFNVSSYYWHCGQYTTSEMCSFAFCVDAELAAWRGGEDRVLDDVYSVIQKYPNRAKIMCGSTFENPGCAVETYTTTPTVYPAAPRPDSTSMARR